LDRHDEARIKRIIVEERPPTTIGVVSEHAAGMRVRRVERRISKNNAVNPGDLIECVFNLIPWWLGEVDGGIDRRRYRIEAFVV
jgi:hypothetical protein